MAKRRARPQAGGAGSRGRGSSGGGAGRLVLGFVLGGAAACAAGYLYLHGRDREATSGMTASRPAPAVAPVSRPGPVVTPRLAIRQPPFGSSEEVFEGGARVYAARCASCHGTPRREARGRVGSPQLFGGARQRLSAQAPGEVYREIAEGAPAKGMPAYAGVLTETQLWQVTLLLRGAEQELPDPVVAILNR